MTTQGAPIHVRHVHTGNIYMHNNFRFSINIPRQNDNNLIVRYFQINVLHLRSQQKFVHVVSHSPIYPTHLPYPSIHAIWNNSKHLHIIINIFVLRKYASHCDFLRSSIKCDAILWAQFRWTRHFSSALSIILCQQRTFINFEHQVSESKSSQRALGLSKVGHSWLQ